MSTVMVYNEARKDVTRTTATEVTDQALRTRSGSLNLLVSNFDRFYVLLHRYLLHRLFDAELAEELTGQTFYKAAATARRLPENATHMQAWLLRAATNLANTHYRRKRLHQLLLGRFAEGRPAAREPEADPNASVDQQPAHVRAALLALPPKYQAVIVLRFYTHLSVREISEVLGCRQDAVRTRLSRAMKKLREWLDIHGSSSDT
ncbi:MAG: sigma-70 family RNA polymerase sigma factor [Phycisphaerales bacterium]|nr:MAG: sigma-70 family RNA polymerase sigma factor [Phycisphaerales bacterium]